MKKIKSIIVVLSSIALLFGAMLSSLYAIDDYDAQKHSFLGAGVKYSCDKPFFKGNARRIKRTKKVEKILKEDPMKGGLITKNLFGNAEPVRRGYHYIYSKKYSRPVMFSNHSADLLCPECRARAVLNACPKCKGKPFEELCDKCKARAILNACAKCKARIMASLKEEEKEYSEKKKK